MAEQTHSGDGEQDPKYGSFETSEGETVVYDRDEPTAWLQSDTVTTVRN
jgi:hypothetical protein